MEENIKQVVKRIKEKTNQETQQIKEKKEKYIQCFEVRNLYIDNEQNITKTKRILQNVTFLQCSWAYILHDKDFYTENTFNEKHELIGKQGEKKKEHYHLYCYLYSPLTIGDIAQHLQCETKDIEKVKPKHYDNKLLYLTHICYDETKKHRYLLKEVHTNIKDYIQNLYMNYQPKENIIPLVIKYSDDNKDRKITKKDFVKLCLEKDMLQDVKSLYNICKDIIDEHNKNVEFYQKENENDYFKAQLERRKTQEMWQKISHLCDSFGCTTLDNDGEIYVIKKGNQK